MLSVLSAGNCCRISPSIINAFCPAATFSPRANIVPPFARVTVLVPSPFKVVTVTTVLCPPGISDLNFCQGLVVILMLIKPHNVDSLFDGSVAALWCGDRRA